MGELAGAGGSARDEGADAHGAAAAEKRTGVPAGLAGRERSLAGATVASTHRRLAREAAMQAPTRPQQRMRSAQDIHGLMPNHHHHPHHDTAVSLAGPLRSVLPPVAPPVTPAFHQAYEGVEAALLPPPSISQHAVDAPALPPSAAVHTRFCPHPACELRFSTAAEVTRHIANAHDLAGTQPLDAAALQAEGLVRCGCGAIFTLVGLARHRRSCQPAPASPETLASLPPLGTRARVLAETALIADSVQLDAFVHSAWRTPVVITSIEERREFQDCVRSLVALVQRSGNDPQTFRAAAKLFVILPALVLGNVARGGRTAVTARRRRTRGRVDPTMFWLIAFSMVYGNVVWHLMVALSHRHGSCPLQIRRLVESSSTVRRSASSTSCTRAWPLPASCRRRLPNTKMPNVVRNVCRTTRRAWTLCRAFYRNMAAWGTACVGFSTSLPLLVRNRWRFN
ncbi:hypothetical protein RI054_32g126260 [Pseudoscourfieldia marina]